MKIDNVTGFPNDPGTPLNLTAGFDWKQAGWLYGTAFGVGSTKQSYGDNRGAFSQREGSISFYAANLDNPLWASAIASIGLLNSDISRDVPIGVTVQHNSGSTSGYNVSIGGEIGYRMTNGAWKFTPVAGLILQHIEVEGFTETGGFTSLSFGSQTRNSAVSEIGYQVSYSLGQWEPYAKLAWYHEFVASDRQVTASLTTIAAPSFSMPAVVLGSGLGAWPPRERPCCRSA